MNVTEKTRDVQAAYEDSGRESNLYVHDAEQNDIFRRRESAPLNCQTKSRCCGPHCHSPPLQFLFAGAGRTAAECSES